jgi:hypothetical protein
LLYNFFLAFALMLSAVEAEMFPARSLRVAPEIASLA